MLNQICDSTHHRHITECVIVKHVHDTLG
jgi:hypothetical protein